MKKKYYKKRKKCVYIRKNRKEVTKIYKKEQNKSTFFRCFCVLLRKNNKRENV